MNYNELIKLVEKYAQAASSEKGAYVQVLENANLWFNDDKLYSILDRTGAETLMDIYITINPDLSVILKLNGKHAAIPAANKLIQQEVGTAMTAALRKASNELIPPQKPMTWLWKKGFGYK